MKSLKDADTVQRRLDYHDGRANALAFAGVKSGAAAHRYTAAVIRALRDDRDRMRDLLTRWQ